MSGAPDPQYVVARSVLLDALDALGAQRQAVILVGAQAVYLHTGAVELAVAAFTTDADLTLDPALLQPAPEIESAMTAAGFHRGNRVGTWVVSRNIDGTPTNVEVDLMVPEAVGDKDALDVLRLLQATATAPLAATFVQLLRADVSKTVTDEALKALKELFTNARAVGAQMAVRSAGALAAPDEIAGSCAALASDLLAAIEGARKWK
jgi:hypothetical protein